MDYKFLVGDKVKIIDDIADEVIETTNSKICVPAISLSKGAVYQVVEVKNEADITIIDDVGKEVSILSCYFDKADVKESVLDNLHKKQEELSQQHNMFYDAYPVGTQMTVIDCDDGAPYSGVVCSDSHGLHYLAVDDDGVTVYSSPTEVVYCSADEKRVKIEKEL